MATRVLWLTKGLGPGGTERLLVELARARDPARVEPVVAYVLPWKDHLAGELEEAGVETICLSTRRQDPRWPLRLRQLIGGFDVVHSHSPVPAVAARLAASTLLGTPRPALMTTEHNTWTAHRTPTRWANRLTSGLDAATFVVTEQTRVSMRGAAARRAEVLVHGIDVDRTATRPDGERAAVRAELALGADEIVICAVANLRAQKDYPTLLGAARRLVDRGVPYRLVAVGQGPLEREIAALRDELGLRDHVVLTGYRQDALAVMAACDVFVLASAWEGLPVAAMEAAALGLPIVATAVGGMVEQFGPTDAVLVPPRDPVALADALEAVVVDTCRRSELSAAARRAATRFDVRRAMQTLTSRYEQLAGVPAGPGRPPAARASTPPGAGRASGDGRRQGTDPLAARHVARLARRRSVPRAARVEARAQPVRAVARLGGRTRRPGRRRPPVHALGVQAGRLHAARGAGGRHRDAP